MIYACRTENIISVSRKGYKEQKGGLKMIAATQTGMYSIIFLLQLGSFFACLAQFEF